MTTKEFNVFSFGVFLMIFALMAAILLLTSCNPTICRAWDYQKNDWKYKVCMVYTPGEGRHYEKEKSVEESTITPTEYIYPTEDEWTPYPTDIPEVTEPYPSIEVTWTPEPPYPLPLDSIWWWQR